MSEQVLLTKEDVAHRFVEGVSSPAGLSEEALIAIPRRMATEVLTKGNLDAVDELLDPEFVDHNPLPGAPPGRDGFRVTIDVFRTAFPDMTVIPLHYIVDGDRVVEHSEVVGTHEGTFFGIPPTHAPVWISAIVILRIGSSGRIIERWGQYNSLGILQQLGIVPGGEGPTHVDALPDVAPVPVASPDDSRARLRHYVDAVWNNGDATVAHDLIHPAAVTPYNPELPPGPAGTLQLVGALRTSFPDLRVTLLDVIARGDLVGARMSLEGTHDGPLLGAPPTGRRVRFEQMAVLKTSGSRIVATWLETDLPAALQQVGLTPGQAPRREEDQDA